LPFPASVLAFCLSFGPSFPLSPHLTCPSLSFFSSYFVLLQTPPFGHPCFLLPSMLPPPCRSKRTLLCFDPPNSAFSLAPCSFRTAKLFAPEIVFASRRPPSWDQPHTRHQTHFCFFFHTLHSFPPRKPNLPTSVTTRRGPKLQPIKSISLTSACFPVAGIFYGSPFSSTSAFLKHPPSITPP